MAITKELLINELKNDLINKAGISRSGFANIDNRYIYI